MKPAALAILIPVLSCNSALASYISPEIAIDVARGVLMSGRTRAAADNSLEIVRTLTSREGITEIYIVQPTDNIGFAIVAADDAAAPLLGYSMNSDFDVDEMPENMKSWLDEYRRQIDYAVINNLDIPRETISPTEDIEPIIKTKWDQLDPYNRACPRTDYGFSPTGCVATAMAQVMKYYSWPEKASGLCVFEGNDVKLSTRYSWSSMLDEYENAEISYINAMSVAALMYDCGRSVDMVYGDNSSGALTFDIPEAMVRNFSYDKSIMYSQRDYYGKSEWTDLLYSEISSGRPVIYAGDSETAGHQFILDGYKAGGYFHVNWGWSGHGNGYFLLDALEPPAQETGGGIGAFKYNQDAIYSIKPECGGKTPIVLSCPGNFSWSGKDDVFIVTDSPYMTQWGPQNYFINLTGQDFKATPAVCSESLSNGEKRYFGDHEQEAKLFGRWYLNATQISTNLSELADGEYRIIPGALDQEGQFTPAVVANGYNGALLLNVKDGIHTYTEMTSSVVVESVGPDMKQVYPVYDITGRMIAKDFENAKKSLVPGIYIVNGKKIII